MAGYVPLAKEYRGDLLDLTHYGYLTIVDEHSNVIFHAGDPDAVVFYRSSSKPIQALPVIARGLDKQYGLTEKETVLFAGSHPGETFHIEAIESIMKKCGFTEDMLVMKPAIPSHPPANEARIRQGLPPHKYYHNCVGKHAALLMLQRALGHDPRDYWKIGAAAELEVQDALQKMSETDKMQLAIDGCGVPVFATGMKHIATAFKNMACIDTIKDESLQRAVAEYAPRLHKYPAMIRGTGYICTHLNSDPNIIAKGGAMGLYAFGLKKERLGVAFKCIDGTADTRALIVLNVLRGLGCLSAETEAKLIKPNPMVLYNDNGTQVGRREVCFDVNI